MKSRGLVVAIAVVLAVLAAVGVIVYTNSLEKSITEAETTLVAVSKTDIPSNTLLTPLVDSGNFDLIRVPNTALVSGAITSTDALRDQTTAAPILANEQIPVTRLSGELNVIGISEDHVGLGLSIEGPQAVNGLIQQGDNIVVFATFKKGTPVTRVGLQSLLSKGQIEEFFDSVTGQSTAPLSNQDVLFMPFDFTMTLVQTVKVLSVQNPPVDQSTGRRTEGASLLVLDALPEDARNVVFGSSQATLYLGLLPPENEDGYPTDATFGVPLVKVTGVTGK